MAPPGSFAGDALLFRNPDGSLTAELFNPFERVFNVRLELDGEELTLPLEPRSVNSLIIGGNGRCNDVGRDIQHAVRERRRAPSEADGKPSAGPGRPASWRS